MRNKGTPPEIPTKAQLENELQRIRRRDRVRNVVRSTVYSLVVIAAVAVIVISVWFPALRIYGASMSPTLNEGDIVLSCKGAAFRQGDLISFYHGNEILVKRVIAGPGETVDIDEAGNVSVDGKMLSEPYLREKAFGNVDIGLPYQVPENRYFCMGDHRSTSVDSRHTEIGCIPEENIVGKIVFRVWPLKDFGLL